MIGLRAICVTLGLVVLLVTSCLATDAQTNAPASQGEPKQAIKIETLTRESFNALPDDAVIELKRGTRTTAGALRARTRQRIAEARAKAGATSKQAQAKFAKFRVRFLKEQEARLNAENATVREEIARRRRAAASPLRLRAAPSEAIRREAIQILEGYKTASPAERYKLDERAGELVRKLQR